MQAINIDNTLDYQKLEIPSNQSELDEQLVQLMTMYYNNPILFTEQILNVKPDIQQRVVLESLRTKKKSTVKSGRGAGKTYIAACAIWWYLCTRYNAQVYISAASGGVMQGGIWPTISAIHQKMHPLFKDDFEVQATQIKHKVNANTWFCLQRTAKKEAAENIAGAHNLDMLYVLDESSGIDDLIFKTIFGSLTEQENYLLMLSNPRRLQGFFFDSFKAINSTVYDQLTMSAIESEWVTDEIVEHWKKLYGENSNTYRIEVLGEFPLSTDESIIPWDLVSSAAERKPEDVDSDGQLYWGLDVGSIGVDNSVLVERRGNLVLDTIKSYKEKDTMKLINMISNKYHNRKKENRPDKIFIDANTWGRGAYERGKELGLPIIGVLSQEKAFDAKYFVNRRAEMWISARDWFRDEEACIPNDVNLIEELTNSRQAHHTSGRFLVESKKDYLKRAGKSPDYADALIMTFYRKRKVKSEIVFI